MPVEKKKYGWTAKGIIGFVFVPMGLLYLALGLGLSAAAFDGREREGRIFLLVFAAVGGVFLLAGLALLLADIRRRHRQRAAYEGGYCVMAAIAGVVGSSRGSGNGSQPVQVECHYVDPATGIAHVYYSRYLHVQVADLLRGDRVPLYLDRMDPSVGFVDIDAVLPKIEVHR